MIGGSFARTFLEDRAAIKLPFQHGNVPYLGDKVLGLRWLRRYLVARAILCVIRRNLR